MSTSKTTDTLQVNLDKDALPEYTATNSCFPESPINRPLIRQTS